MQLSPPDRHGLCTLGTSVDAARAAVDSATFVLAEINASMPCTHGRTLTERGEMLVSIAHPNFRGGLTERLRGLKRFVSAGPDQSRGWPKAHAVQRL